MSPAEKKEQELLPEKYKPMGAWGYFWLSILFSVPVVGFVFLIIFSISDGNISRRSFARSHWCSFILVAVVFIIVLIIASAAGMGIGELFEEISYSLPF